MMAPHPCTIPVVIVLLELLVSNHKIFCESYNFPKSKVPVFYIMIFLESKKTYKRRLLKIGISLLFSVL